MRTRRDHLRWYIPAANNTRKTYGWRKGWNHLWASRFWWSGGLLAKPPIGHRKDAWR